jgi:hypothetical protein
MLDEPQLLLGLSLVRRLVRHQPRSPDGAQSLSSLAGVDGNATGIELVGAARRSDREIGDAVAVDIAERRDVGAEAATARATR